MMTTITYTVIKNEGEVVESGLSLNEAAGEILTDDGAEYQIRPEDRGGYSIWTRNQIANRPWKVTGYTTIKTDLDEAEYDLFMQVISSDLNVITDKEYLDVLNRQIKDLEYEEDEEERARGRARLEAEISAVTSETQS